MKIIKIILAAVIIAAGQGCADHLNEEVFSQLDPSNLLNSPDGVETVLFAAYNDANLVGHDGKSIMNLEDWSTDLEWETGGGENRTAELMINFTWDASTDWIVNRMWNRTYRAVRNANIVIDNLGDNLSDEQKRSFEAEARFVRAISFYRLYTWFESVPLRASSVDPPMLAKATKEDMEEFLEAEFLAMIPNLPPRGQEPMYGRATRGAAMGFLTKFYLNSKQWQKCADMAAQVIALNQYDLFPRYEDLFKVDNKKNNEFIWANQSIVEGNGCMYINGAFPIGFRSTVDGSFTFTATMANWAAQYRLYDSFYNTFEDGDERKNLIISRYINNAGNEVSLMGANNTRSFKYWPDINAVQNNHGNDQPEVRYADILLARAEALNEINGPVQAAIDLINMVRTRAKVLPLQLNDFTTKDALRDHILKERAWEFYNERIRRQDLIRHGRYIEQALARGATNAQSHHVRFPIPQTEIDANELCVQHDGY